MTQPSASRVAAGWPSWPGLCGLYAIADADACAAQGLELETVACAFLAARLPLVQVRAKGWSPEQLARLAVRLLPEVTPPSRLILNDHLDLVLRLRREQPGRAEALGLHVGQGDVALSEVRRASPDLFCGISTHDLAQVQAALADEAALPSYLAFGPVFPTASKHNPEPTTGIFALAQVHQELIAWGLPLVAIGGIQPDSLEQVASHCDLVASISMMLPPRAAGDGPDEDPELARERTDQVTEVKERSPELTQRSRELHGRICATVQARGAQIR